MAEEKRKKILELPMKILFNDEGINFFVKSNKKLTKFKFGDEGDHYGIVFDTFSPPSVQKMLLIDYITIMEISRPEFSSRRQDVLDLSKLITYGTLYRRFDELVFARILDSEVVRKWNKANPSSLIDRKTAVGEGFLQQALEKNKAVVSSIRQEMLRTLVGDVQANSDLQPEEKNVQLFLAEKYLTVLRPLSWFILIKFKDSPELPALFAGLEGVLQEYMVKSKLSEYLSLMTMELVSMTENLNLQGFSKTRYKGTLDPMAVLYDPELRRMIVEEMRVRNLNLAISWRLGGGGAGGRERLQVRISNRDSAAPELKAPDETRPVTFAEHSLADFYREGVDETTGSTELGTLYLTTLTDECARVGVGFEATVRQAREVNHTVITLNLLF